MYCYIYLHAKEISRAQRAQNRRCRHNNLPPSLSFLPCVQHTLASSRVSRKIAKKSRRDTRERCSLSEQQQIQLDQRHEPVCRSSSPAREKKASIRARLRARYQRSPLLLLLIISPRITRASRFRKAQKGRVMRRVTERARAHLDRHQL